jgi:CHASE3 domain sensor protein
MRGMDGRQRLGMRLSSKMFLSSALVIVVLTSVSALSLGAVGRLVSVNRETTTRTIPAMSLTSSARDAIPRLVGLETRALVLGDERYVAAWNEMATRLAEDLERLAELPLSEPETRHRLVASAAFEEYRSIVGEERALLRRGDRGGALRLTDTMSSARAEEVRRAWIV